MIRPALLLLNGVTVDALPTGLLAARRSADARQMARASWLLRRKQDGRFIATIGNGCGGLQLQPLDPSIGGMRDGVDRLLGRLGLERSALLQARQPVALRPSRTTGQCLPEAPRLLDTLLATLEQLQIDPWRYRAATGLPLTLEPPTLTLAGRDRYRRPLWLTAVAARAWRAMQRAAARDDIVLEAISGFRSHAYQAGIFRMKLRRGQDIAQILAVNAAPGFSEHHSGCALDIGTPGEPPAEESFERTAAFGWLQRNAGRFGFRLSYPRDNPHGIVYEPWHWCFAAGDQAAAGRR